MPALSIPENCFERRQEKCKQKTQFLAVRVCVERGWGGDKSKFKNGAPHFCVSVFKTSPKMWCSNVWGGGRDFKYSHCVFISLAEQLDHHTNTLLRGQEKCTASLVTN
jgi:hypothetical protein